MRGGPRALRPRSRPPPLLPIYPSPPHSSAPPRPFARKRRCNTFQPQLGGFCWDKQAEFSAYRNSTFGSGTLRLLNASVADWRFYSTATGKSVLEDSVVLDKAAQAGCTNRAR